MKAGFLEDREIFLCQEFRFDTRFFKGAWEAGWQSRLCWTD
jgi:hypothetical protein